MVPKMWRSSLVVEVKAIELVDDLAHRVAGLHVVVQSVENLADDAGAIWGVRGFEILEGGEQAVGRVV